MSVFARDMHWGAFFLLSFLVSVFLPYLIGVLTPLSDLEVPLIPSQIRNIFYGGLVSPVLLNVSLVLYALFFSTFWFWREVASQENFRNAGFLVTLAAVPLAAVLNWYLLFQWGLAGACKWMVQFGPIQVTADGQGGWSGDLTTDLLCYFTWYFMLLCMGGLGRLVALLYARL